jgi:hypothetical protein
MLSGKNRERGKEEDGELAVLWPVTFLRASNCISSLSSKATEIKMSIRTC